MLLLIFIIGVFGTDDTNSTNRCTCMFCDDTKSVYTSYWHGFEPCQKNQRAFLTYINFQTTDGSIIDIETKNTYYSTTYYTGGSAFGVSCFDSNNYVGGSSEIGVLITCKNLLYGCPYKYNIRAACRTVCDYKTCEECNQNDDCGWCPDTNKCQLKSNVCVNDYSTECKTPKPIPTPIPEPTPKPVCTFNLINPHPKSTLQIGHYYTPTWEYNCGNINEIAVRYYGTTDMFTIQKNIPFAIFYVPQFGSYKYDLLYDGTSLGIYEFYIASDSCRNLDESLCQQKEGCELCNSVCSGNAFTSGIDCVERHIQKSLIIIVSVVTVCISIIVMIVIIVICVNIRKKNKMKFEKVENIEFAELGTTSNTDIQQNIEIKSIQETNNLS